MFHKDISGDPDKSVEDLVVFSLEAADDEARPGLWLKPGRFRWHNKIGVGDVEQLINCAGVHGDSSDAVGLAAALKFRVTTDTSDKVNSVVTLDVFDAKDLFEDELVDYLGVKLCDGRAKVDLIGLDGHSIPPIINVEAVVVLCLDSGSFTIGKRAKGKVFLEGCHELLRCHLVERLENTVVVEAQQVVSWVEQGHEEVERLFASDLLSRLEGSLSSELANIIGSGCPVMPISYVQSLDLLKLSDKPSRIFHAALPEHVSDLVFASDIAVGSLRGDDLAHARLDAFLVLSEGQEDRAHICGLDISQLCSVVLFFLQSKLVPLDAVVLVIID